MPLLRRLASAAGLAWARRFLQIFASSTRTRTWISWGARSIIMASPMRETRQVSRPRASLPLRATRVHGVGERASSTSSEIPTPLLGAVVGLLHLEPRVGAPARVGRGLVLG